MALVFGLLSLVVPEAIPVRTCPLHTTSKARPKCFSNERHAAVAARRRCHGSDPEKPFLRSAARVSTALCSPGMKFSILVEKGDE